MVDNSIIDTVTNAKLLGIWFEDSLKWNLQVDNAIKNASKRIYNLVLLSRSGCNKDILIKFYKYMIRSILTYSYPCWCNATQSSMNKIVKFEKWCYKMMRSSYDLPIDQFCINSCLSLATKVNNIPEHPLRDLFIIHNTSRTRSQRQLVVHSGRTVLYTNSFLKYFI